MRIGRRALGVGLAGVAASAVAQRARADDAAGDAGSIDVRSVRLEHEVTLALPRGDAPAPLVVLLHGLAETSDERAGARAWIDRYGLSRAMEGHALAFACPYVPRMDAAKLDGYARWLADTLVPRVRAELGARVDASPARIGGCSYGGWVSLEAFLRARGSTAFAAWAGVQTAIGQASATSYADRLARVANGRPLLVETSTRDPFHDANVALANALDARHVARDLVVLPGPHDQPWLRASGTPRLLAWLDRA